VGQVWRLEFQLLLADTDAFTCKSACRLEGIPDRHVCPTRFWSYTVEWLGFLPSVLTLKKNFCILLIKFTYVYHMILQSQQSLYLCTELVDSVSYLRELFVFSWSESEQNV